jgi:4-amino-4-deoxy-L-arabinose transferase-like glycosyltransferase
VAFLFTMPYALSLPGAFVRAARQKTGVNRRGVAFLVIWFVSLLIFFTASIGKETRYFLPAMPPLFVLLGIELAMFFDPARRPTPRRDQIGFWSVVVLAPAGALAGGFGVLKWYKQIGRFDLFDWQQRAALRQIAQQESRVIWYSDVRFPRIVDQLELLEMQGGQRSREVETRIVFDEMVRRLAAPELALLVAWRSDYVRFMTEGSRALAEQGREMPPVHVWMLSRLGRPKTAMIVFGNQPPPWPEPDVDLPASAPSSQPATRPEAGP